MTSNYFDKYKYNQIHNILYKKYRILNTDRFSRLNNPNPVKSNNFKYFPIESDNYKTEGHTIYLATQDEDNYNNKENNIYENLHTETKDNSYKFHNKKLIIRNGNFIAQRTIYFSYYRKYNNTLSRRSLRKNCQIHISENKIYDFNKTFNNKDNNNSNIFNIVETKQMIALDNENEKIKNYPNKALAYRKKITSNQYKPKRDYYQEDNQLNDKIITKVINFKKYKEIDNNKNKEERLITETNSDNNKLNTNENNKGVISKNNSLNEYLNVTTSQSNTDMNTSIDGLPYQNKSLIYNSLSGNIFDNLNNSKIMEKKFLDGIKNEQRKVSKEKKHY